MLHSVLYALVLSLLLPRCSAICCNNHNFLCVVNSEVCDPNCADGISLCDCPKACLNDGLGGCNTGVTCDGPDDDGHTVTVVTSVLTGQATSIDTVYETTSTDYYSTYTAVNVVTEDSTSIATSTIYQTITSTVFVTVPGPQATIFARALLDVEGVRQASFGIVTSFKTSLIVPRILRRYHAYAKRTVTITSTYSDPTNYCGQDGFPNCVDTTTLGVVDSEVATTTVQSTAYNSVNSLVYTTVDSYYYVTLTDTAAGNTVTIAPSTTSTPSSTSTSSSTTEPNVTVTNMGTAVVTETSTPAAVNSEGNVVVTNSNTAVVTVTAPMSSSSQAGSGTRLRKFMGIYSLVLWQAFLHIL